MNIKHIPTLIFAIVIAGATSLGAAELSGRKVVIDPGHGGSDPGATGVNGGADPNEADFNLAVGLKLRTLLQNAGCTVVMTRSSDVAVDLYARRDLVNAENPHASLCIHCNSASDATAHGTETFWCLDYCNGDAAADQDLANKVQSRLVQFLGRTSRGVKRYNFVMVSPTPPSILGEMLFVSNQAEFDLINSAAGQDSAAAAFLYGVLDRVGVVDPSTPSGLAATAVSASQINLTWNDNSGLEDSYKIERATSASGPWSEIASNPANDGTYSSTGLSGGTTYYYRVRAYDAYLGSSAYSGTASATTQVSGAPSITSQPAGRTVDPGTNVTFTVVATGNPTLTYQWRKDAVNISNGGKFSGATTATLAITNVQQTEVGNYSVVVANAVGSATSGNAALTVNSVIAFYEDFESGLGNWTVFPPPGSTLDSSTAQYKSANHSAYVNSSWDRMYRDLGVRVDGKLRITAWVYDSTQTRSFVDMRGYSGGTFGSGNLMQLFCAGKYNSVTMAGEIWDNTKYQGRVVAGSNTGWFNLNAAGAPSRSPGWHKFVIERQANGTTIDFFVDGILSRTITGATLYSLDSAAIGSVASGATEVLGDSWIDDVKVEYFDLPGIMTQPASQTVAAGGTAVFTVATSNTVTAYQWHKNGTNIAGATTSALTLSNVQDGDVASYDVTVSNGAGPVISSAATLSVSPAIVVQPVNQTNSAGTVASFTVTAAGQLPLSYRWKKNGADLLDGDNVSGATTTELTLTAVSQEDAATYTVAVSNVAGGVLSAPAMLVVADPPSIETPPAGRAVAAGSTVTFSVIAGGTPPLSYQWRLNESSIPGATDSTYSRTDVQSADAGTYSVEVANAAGAVSAEAVLTVNTAPTLPAISNPRIHAGATATVTVVASDIDVGQGLTYSLGSGAPAEATIGASSGIFTWPTGSDDAGASQSITVNVTDDGIPSLGDSTTFTVTVAAPPLIQAVELSGTNVVLTWTAIEGKTYRVEYKNNPDDPEWSNLPPDVTASAATASKEDALGVPQRFYRILSLD